MKRREKANMHTFWFQASEMAALILDILIGEMHPLQTLTALTTLIVVVVMTYFMRRRAPLRHLVVLWAIATATLLVWVVCTLILHYAGLL
jgi:hypothetical protein